MRVAHYVPDSLDALFDLLSGDTSGLYVLGGGTDLTIQIRSGEKRPRGLIWMGKLSDAHGIQMTDAGLEIGAMVTMAELSIAPELTGSYAALAHAAHGVGSEQIRSTATLGGNIANAAPGADTLPALLLLEAEVQIATPSGIEWRKLMSILPDGEGLKSNELILSVRLPRRGQDWRSAFYKLGSRQTVTISRLSLALGLRLENDIIQDVRAFTGAVALRPLEVEETRTALTGRILDEKTGRILGEVLERFVRKTIPDRSSMPYKAWAAKAVAADTMAKIALEG